MCRTAAVWHPRVTRRSDCPGPGRRSLLLSLNLRTAAVSVGPVLDEVRAGLGMSAASAGLLTSLPVLAFAVFGALAPAAARAARRAPGDPGWRCSPSWSGCSGARWSTTSRPSSRSRCSPSPGMAIANVLLPSLVRLHFPDRIGLVTALYTTALADRPDRGARAHRARSPTRSAAGGSASACGRCVALVAARPLARPAPRATAPASRPPATIRFLDVARTRLGLGDGGVLRAPVPAGVRRLRLVRDAVARRRASAPRTAGALVGLVAAMSIPLSLWAPPRWPGPATSGGSWSW